MQSGNNKKQRKIQTLEQWVEVTIENGKTITALYPSNNQLIEEGKAMDPPPGLIYRRINFPDGVPPEYSWTGPSETHIALGGMGIQRMTVDTWLKVIEEEDKDPSGHIGPTRVGNLPRPHERGGCTCSVCEGNGATEDVV
jgi:hypothetical protein